MDGSDQIPSSTRIIHAVFDFLLRRRHHLLIATMTVAAIGFVTSGFHIVKKEERGVRVRFGEVVATDIQPGLRYRIPIVEEMPIRQTMRIERQQIASREGDIVVFTILTGDTNLLEIDLILQYRIADLKKYLYIASDPHKLIGLLAREHLLSIIGQNFIDLVLTQNRNIIESYIAEHLRLHLSECDVGLETVSVSIVDIRPIEETLDAFRDVNDATAERIQMISNANQSKEQMLARSRGQADAILLNAKSQARQRIVQARGSALAFSALLAEYQKRPDQVAITRYWQRMRTILAEAKLMAVKESGNSTIDVNMIEGLAAIPTQLPKTPHAKDAQPWPASTYASATYAYENADADKHLFDGRFHTPKAERDHLRIANSRSLIFDNPSIFRHRHVVSRNGVVRRLADEIPMVQQSPVANEQGDGQHGKHGERSDDHAE